MRIQNKLLILLLAATASQATTIYVRDAAGGVDKDNNPTGYFKTNDVLNNAGTIGVYSVPAGTLSLEMSFNNPNGAYLPLLTYCADPSLPLTVPGSTQPGGAFTVRSLSDFGYSANVINAVDLLWANAFQDSMTSATKAAAFQFLLWEYINDTSYGLNTGNIKVSNSAVAAQVNTWNTQLSTWTAKANLMVLDGKAESKQSLFYDAGAGVPEPSTYAMIGAGLAAVAAYRRKRS